MKWDLRVDHLTPRVPPSEIESSATGSRVRALAIAWGVPELPAIATLYLQLARLAGC